MSLGNDRETPNINSFSKFKKHAIYIYHLGEKIGTKSFPRSTCLAEDESTYDVWKTPGPLLGIVHSSADTAGSENEKATGKIIYEKSETKKQKKKKRKKQ